MKFFKLGFYIFCFVLFGRLLAASSQDNPISLKIDPRFSSELKCKWDVKGPMKFWVGEITDKRKESPLGVLVTKQGDVTISSEQPIEDVFKRVMESGLEECGATLVSEKKKADIAVSGLIEDFCGTSKKGWIGGRAQGQVRFTLTLKRLHQNYDYSETFMLEETHLRFVSKKPKALQNVLNELLTRLALDIFQSTSVQEWLLGQAQGVQN